MPLSILIRSSGILVVTDSIEICVRLLQLETKQSYIIESASSERISSLHAAYLKQAERIINTKITSKLLLLRPPFASSVSATTRTRQGTSSRR